MNHSVLHSFELDTRILLIAVNLKLHNVLFVRLSGNIIVGVMFRGLASKFHYLSNIYLHTHINHFLLRLLQARCSILAAANPIGGRYDPSLTFAENVSADWGWSIMWVCCHSILFLVQFLFSFVLESLSFISIHRNKGT